MKTYLPDGIGVEIEKAGGSTLNYLHRDRLGSVVAMSSQAGELVESQAYDSWGKRREQASPATPDQLDGVLDNKGFTDHEMLDQLDLVHMNGRVYDPLVARFMSADPIIQEPEHSQSYNRYTYVWNNPTNLTDPTGFIGEGPRPANSVIPECQDSRTECDSGGKPSRDEQPQSNENKPNKGKERNAVPGQTANKTETRQQRNARVEYELSHLQESIDKQEQMQQVIISRAWGKVESWAIAKQNETGNWLYSIPGTLATILSTPEYTAKLQNGFAIIGALKGRGKPPPPLKSAEGRPHSIIERSGPDGQYTTSYEDGSWKQYRGSGQDHGGIPRPNVKEAGVNTTPDGQTFIDKGRVRPATSDEIPGG